MQEQPANEPLHPTPRKPRLAAIEYIRGISMTGVIGIHVGSQYIMNPASNIHLIALFEIVTRFSVPIFFFISAFGLFYNLDLHKTFSYRAFLSRRFNTVIIPNIVWSIFNLIHDAILYGSGLPSPFRLAGVLFFGVAKYQLYFLVLLTWFYLAMPLWIRIIRHTNKAFLLALLLFQLAFDYWSSFSVPFNTFVYALPDASLLKPLLMYRLNYWILHYVFIFVLGGHLAVHIDAFHALMRRARGRITLFFWGSLACLLAFYYHLILAQGYTPIEAINTAHQLCPAGIFYTIAASLFFFTIFTYQRYPKCLNPILHQLVRHSYIAYLAHPLAITYLALLMAHTHSTMTAPLAILFYVATLLLAVGTAAIFRQVGTVFPWLNKLTIGTYSTKR